MHKVIICRGLPSSGKSTYAKQWVLEDPEHRIRINQDDIRNMLGKYWVPSRENLVQYIQEEAIIEALDEGYNIIIDNTNMNKKVLNKYIALFEIYGMGYEIVYKDFFDTPLSVCIERNNNRETEVTEKVIRDFYERYKNDYPLNGN